MWKTLSSMMINCVVRVCLLVSTVSAVYRVLLRFSQSERPKKEGKTNKRFGKRMKTTPKLMSIKKERTK